ncbi:uncharacterized protein LOC124998063 isoform X2 [Mugil cephalus]|uniref:uncharacterized protein LOC124998063 isoform X2 n=1 Tax=Mugil cephalus TaxID=48193 RepID=UPI001FB64D5C|nr:uncharacterized protein LOC124998063 isoform X2 [Mugil cephalus]
MRDLILSLVSSWRHAVQQLRGSVSVHLRRPGRSDGKTHETCYLCSDGLISSNHLTCVLPCDQSPHGNRVPAESPRPVRPPPKPPVDRRLKPSFNGTSSVKPPTTSAEETAPRSCPRPHPRLLPPGPRPQLRPVSPHSSHASSVDADRTSRPRPQGTSFRPALPTPSKAVGQKTSPPPPPLKPPPPLPSFIQTRCPPYVDVLPVETSSLRTESLCWMASSHRLNSDDEVTVQLRWLRRMSKSDFMDLTPPYHLDVQEGVRSLNQRALDLRRALYLYKLLMARSRDQLRKILSDFRGISETLDKVKQKNRNMGIAGGTTGAVGGVAAVVGIALAPVTMGVSLVATAVGAGMVASAGGMGAHAVRTNKKMVDRRTVEGLVDNYRTEVVDLEMCLDLVLCGMNELRRLDLARLHRAGALPEALRTAHLAQDVYTRTMDTRTPVHTGGLPSERLLQTFTKEMDQFFTENKGQKLKGSSKSKFSVRVDLLARNLQDELEHLELMHSMLS